MCATSLKNVNLIIVSLSLTDSAISSNGMLFFRLLPEHNANMCFIRAAISGHSKSTFFAVSSFSTYHVPQNHCCNFLEMLLFRYMSLRAGEIERILHIAFTNSLTFQSLELTPAFREPDKIYKLQLPISASFGLSFSSIAAMNFLSTAQFVLGPSNESWFVFVFGRPSILLAIDWYKLS